MSLRNLGRAGSDEERGREFTENTGKKVSKANSDMAIIYTEIVSSLV